MSVLKFKEIRSVVAKLESGGHKWFVQLVFYDKDGLEHTWNIDEDEDLTEIVRDIRTAFQAQRDIRPDYENVWR